MKKSCKYGEYGSCEHLLFLFSICYMSFLPHPPLFFLFFNLSSVLSFLLSLFFIISFLLSFFFFFFAIVVLEKSCFVQIFFFSPVLHMKFGKWMHERFCKDLFVDVKV